MEIFPLIVDPSSAERDAQMLRAAWALAPGWAGVSEARVEEVGGGITNQLFQLSAVGRPPVLARIYGQRTEVVIDREAENRLFERLSRLGFAPPYYGRFLNGRVEGFLEGFRALAPAEMGDPTLQPLIAARLREMHGIPPEDPRPALWDTLERWMGAARQIQFGDERDGRVQSLDLERRAVDLSALKERFEQEIAPAAAGPGAAEAVRPSLCHNDLLSGNILYSEERGEVRLIDYEYSGCSYPAFDIANHFCEYAGFDSDFERGFPGEGARRRFVAAYLEGAPEPEIADFCRIVEFFILPDHLFWGSWALIQAKHSPIRFDFLRYAELRMAGFDFHRPVFG